MKKMGNFLAPYLYSDLVIRHANVREEMKLVAAVYFVWLINCSLAGVLHHREHAAAVDAGYKRLKGSPHGPGQIKVIKITRTYAVPYPVPVPFAKEVPFPVPVEKAVPVAVPHPFPVPVPRPVHIPQPYLVPIATHHANFLPHHPNVHSFQQNYRAHDGNDFTYFEHGVQHHSDNPSDHQHDPPDAQHHTDSSSANLNPSDYPAYDEQDSYFPTGHSYPQPHGSEVEITTKSSPIRYSQPDPGFASQPLEHQYPFSEVHHHRLHFKE